MDADINPSFKIEPQQLMAFGKARLWDGTVQENIGRQKFNVSSLRECYTLGGEVCRILQDPLSGFMVPVDCWGRILSRAQFNEVLSKVDDFYDYGPTAERIAESNRQTMLLEAMAASQLAEPSETSRPGYVYLARGDHGYHKIGKAGDVDARIQALSTASPFAIHLVLKFSTPDPDRLERALHDLFVAKRLRGEWFELDEADLKDIRTLHGMHVPYDMNNVDGK